MRIVYFAHSLRSCWNHGNAHFLRGILTELVARGHQVVACEKEKNWSLENLLADAGPSTLDAFQTCYPTLVPRLWHCEDRVDEIVEEADLVIVHEWNEPSLVARLGALRSSGARFRLFFHDTHHRAVSDPDAIRAFDLDGYDGVLAFGEALAEVYRRWGWRSGVHVWHEAADTQRFHPPAAEQDRDGLVWVGNWGDGERTRELETFLLAPAQRSGLRLDMYGVRYPSEALAMLESYGAHYRGWIPNARTPEIFAHHLMTVHVPRRFYTELLPGIPTIRVFEALACGVPLVCAPWRDCENLFSPGADYLVARNGAEMEDCLHALRHDAGLREALIRHGIATIEARHTCAHRVDELLAIYRSAHECTMERQA